MRSRAFRSVPYSIAGGSYNDESKPLSQQRTLNMYLEQTQNGRSDIVLKSWPGLKLWASGSSTEVDRGIYYKTFLGLGFQVSGATLYSFSSSGIKTSIGTIAGSDQVSFADNGIVLFIVGGNTAYSYDGATLSALSYSFTPSSVDYLDNQFILTATNGRAYILLPGSTTEIAGNSYSPDSSSDNLVISFVFDQFIFNFSELTIEPWELTGSGTPNAQRMTGVINEDTGIAGKDAIASTSSAIYFLGSDNEPRQMIQFQARKIGSPAVSKAIQGYADTENCRVFKVSFGAQDFIQWHFPDQGKTWLYSEQINRWYELDHGASGGRYIGNSIANLFDKNLVGDNQTGNIYELDRDTYQNNGTLMARERIARPLSGETFDNPRQRIQFSELSFGLETGVGNTGAPNPKVMTELSTDGVKFGDQMVHELGREGEYQQDIYHSTNKNCTDMAVKVRCTDNCRFSIYSARALLREAGR